MDGSLGEQASRRIGGGSDTIFVESARTSRNALPALPDGLRVVNLFDDRRHADPIYSSHTGLRQQFCRPNGQRPVPRSGCNMAIPGATSRPRYVDMKVSGRQKGSLFYGIQVAKKD